MKKIRKIIANEWINKVDQMINSLIIHGRSWICLICISHYRLAKPGIGTRWKIWIAMCWMESLLKSDTPLPCKPCILFNGWPAIEKNDCGEFQTQERVGSVKWLMGNLTRLWFIQVFKFSQPVNQIQIPSNHEFLGLWIITASEF